MHLSIATGPISIQRSDCPIRSVLFPPEVLCFRKHHIPWEQGSNGLRKQASFSALEATEGCCAAEKAACAACYHPAQV